MLQRLLGRRGVNPESKKEGRCRGTPRTTAPVRSGAAFSKTQTLGGSLVKAFLGKSRGASYLRDRVDSTVA